MLFTHSAEKEFRDLPRETQQRFGSVFELLAKDPRKRRPKCDVSKLSGVANAWRLKVGDHRGIYAVEGEDVIFTRFGHRKTVYSP